VFWFEGSRVMMNFLCQILHIRFAVLCVKGKDVNPFDFGGHRAQHTFLLVLPNEVHSPFFWRKP